jgi:hypothetical protein
MGNIPVDMALLLLIEKSAANDNELSNNFDIYDICSKKTGGLKLCKAFFVSLLTLTIDLKCSIIGSLRKRRSSFQVRSGEFCEWSDQFDCRGSCVWGDGRKG